MTTNTTAPRLGEVWPGQGGIYAGLVRGSLSGGPDYHLIVATATDGDAEKLAWGARGEDEDGAKHDRDGLANTIALVQSKHDHPAAKWAASLELEGHKDWYLPSRDELALCWINVPDAFKPTWYWSSTQYGRYLAWIQFFDDGDQTSLGKGYEGRARAVRRFIA